MSNLYTFVSDCGRIRLTMTLDQATALNGAESELDQAVLDICAVPEIEQQLRTMHVSTLRDVLKHVHLKFGAGRSYKMASHSLNMLRILWRAGQSIVARPEAKPALHSFVAVNPIVITMTMEQAKSVPPFGDECDAAVLALAKLPELSAQLQDIPVAALREYLTGMDIWTARALGDHQHNLLRVLWQAIIHIRVNPEASRADSVNACFLRGPAQATNKPQFGPSDDIDANYRRISDSITQLAATINDKDRESLTKHLKDWILKLKNTATPDDVV